jgi:simple sugar transport system permease protein
MLVDIEIDAREQTPSWIAYGTPLFAIAAALAVSVVALVAIGVNPIAAYVEMFLRPFGTVATISNVLVRATPLILVGLGVYLPMKAGLWNIGAEGQLLAGAIVGTWIAINVTLPELLVIPVILFGSAIAGGLWAFIPAWLRAKWGISEIITTLLFTFIAADIQLYLVRGPMQGGSGGFPQTELLPEAAEFPAIPGTRAHVGLLVALLVVVLAYVVLNRTRFGFRVNFVGSNPDAAEQAGMSRYRVYLLTLVAGGALAGLAGISEIAGNQSRLHASFAPGYGYTAVPIALLGRNGVFRMLLAALFFALLFVGGNRVTVAMEVPSAIIDIVQALVILFLITVEFFQRYRLSISVGRRDDDQSIPGTEVTTDD